MVIDDINPYIIGKFSIIENNFDEKLISKYYSRWIERYKELFEYDEEGNDTIEMGIREWKAIKSIYASSILYCEAKKAYSTHCEASFYFSLYYSLYHAMYSCLCFDSSISIDKLERISHTSILKVFKNSFCSGGSSISKSEIPEQFIRLRELREYYSYILPINSFAFKQETLDIIAAQLEECFQISTFHSLILDRAFQNHGKIVRFDTEEKYYYFREKFHCLLSRKYSGKYILEPADENKLNETLRDGICFMSIALQLDQTYDEFRTYSDFNGIDGDQALSSNEIYSFIYNCII